MTHRALYTSFDRFPTRKGAAIHINHMARTLFDAACGGLLYVLGDEMLPPYQREGPIEIVRYDRQIPNRLARALDFGRRLTPLLEEHTSTLRLCHFRDPWSGLPILQHRDRTYATVYEVNGLPSIELPYVYPHLPSETQARLRAAEVFCWTHADHIITPSETMRDNLIRLGAAAEKITVLPNGADVPPPTPPPPDAPSRYLLYFGALQRWQGIDVLLRAFAHLADINDLHLVVCVSTRARHAKPYRRLARRLGVDKRVQWRYRLTEAELAPWRANALLSIAPLTECSRNLDQGCCPLKILESMASGVPVVASDLPVVRELVADGVHGRLVRPDRPSELARAIRVLLEYPKRRAKMGRAAQAHSSQNYTWAHTTERLKALYHDLGLQSSVSL